MISASPLLPDFGSLWTDMISWIDQHTAQIALATIAGAALVILGFCVRLLGKRMMRGVTGWEATIGRALVAMRPWFLVAVAAQVIAVYAHAPADIARTIAFFFVIAATLQAALILRALILGAIDVRAREADPAGALANALGLIKLLVSVVLFVVATILILTNLGVDATGLIAGLGVGGIAIGLAAQGIFSDLFAALSILLDQPFRRGDAIRFEATTGIVEAIGLKSTRIRALSGEEVIVSNTFLLSKELRNLSRADHRRVFQTLSLVYQLPLAIAQHLPARLKSMLATIDGAIFVRAGLSAFGASSLDFEFVYDIGSDDPAQILAIRHSVNTTILAEFADAGIAFAYPTQTTFTADPRGNLVMPYASLPT